ncbi:hypothetical protein HDG37_001776 [Paraburkholderia sp. MM5384-R2]|nr:hypothetical protein [Paraburkholderia sp. MM5384-R2]
MIQALRIRADGRKEVMGLWIEQSFLGDVLQVQPRDLLATQILARGGAQRWLKSDGC